MTCICGLQILTMFFKASFIYFFMLSSVYGNQYDPHPFPDTGPFVEGWYARIVDVQYKRSFGLLFGRVLNKTETVYPLIYQAILKNDDPNKSITLKESYPDLNDISIFLNGSKPVKNDPAYYSPPPANFQWIASKNGYFNVSENHTRFNFTIEEIELEGDFGKPKFWRKDGTGPEGWLGKLPFLPLHWFVYSLYTPGKYTWKNNTSGEIIQGSAFLHQEKNWGEGFPSAWVWTQAIKPGAALAGSFGELRLFDLVDVPAHLFGYRNYNKSISLDFGPQDSIVTKSIDGCNGVASFNITSPYYRVVFKITASVSTLNTCLRGPEKLGFRYDLVESYNALAKVKIYKRSSVFKNFSDKDLIEQETFDIAGLEFGGKYLCPDNTCRPNETS